MFPLAYIAGQFPLRSETFVWGEVRELRRRGWDVHTFALYEPDEETPAGLLDLRGSTTTVYGGSRSQRWRNIAGHPRGVSSGAFDAITDREPLSIAQRAKLVVQAGVGAALGAELRRRGVRHVHAHFAHAPTSVAMYAARAAGISFSFTGHANDLFQRRQLLGRKLARASFVACISEWHRDLYRSIVARDDAAYPIVRCGVDVVAFSPTLRPPRRDRARVVTICRLVEKKGVDVLIRAVARLRDDGVGVELTVGGDGPLRASLAALAAELSLDVRFVGALDIDGVRKLLSEADVFALPCRIDSNGDRDGIPVALMEAMACGVPVVAGDLPAIHELVVDGISGLLVGGGDVGATAGAIGKICADPDFSARLSNVGRSRVASEFSFGFAIDVLERKFTDVIARSA